MIHHPAIIFALNLVIISGLFLFAAFCVNLIVYSYIDGAFPHSSLVAAE